MLQNGTDTQIFKGDGEDVLWNDKNPVRGKQASMPSNEVQRRTFNFCGGSGTQNLA